MVWKTQDDGKADLGYSCILLPFLGQHFPTCLGESLAQVISHILTIQLISLLDPGGSPGYPLPLASAWIIDQHLIQPDQPGPELGFEPREFG